jgi:hypothetical protein
MVAVNVPNKQSQTADKGFSMLIIIYGVKKAHRKDN